MASRKKSSQTETLKETKNVKITAPVVSLEVEEDEHEGDEDDTFDFSDDEAEADEANGSLSLDEKKKQFGEVFTPVELVNEILDQLPIELWSNPTKTWLDNSCGEGAFLIQIKRRLMEGLKEWEPDEAKREKHILENQIYGVELQEDNWQRCRINLGLTPTGNDGNIVCSDGLTYNYTFQKNGKGGYVMGDSTHEEFFEQTPTVTSEKSADSKSSAKKEKKEKKVEQTVDTSSMFS